jgi:hypothetical protein
MRTLISLATQYNTLTEVHRSPSTPYPVNLHHNFEAISMTFIQKTNRNTLWAATF